MKRRKKPTNGKCDYFVNANCSYNCPNAKLEYACDKWDLDPSDFGLEHITCKECHYNDNNCNCDDCYMKGNKDYCEKEKERCLNG